MLELRELINVRSPQPFHDVWYQGYEYRISDITLSNKAQPYIKIEMCNKALLQGEIIEGNMTDVLGMLSRNPDLKVDDKVVVWNYPGKEQRRHFSHFGSDGLIRTFNDGVTSFTVQGSLRTSLWRNYRVVDK